jgi:pimeloyl-ACP methyl ester carboxylesterase
MARERSIYKSAEGRDAIMALYGKVLSEWPVPCEQMYLPARAGETFVIASGARAAPPLVLLHGSGSNSATWSYDVIEYSRHARVYAVDIPGEPGKSAPTRFSCRGTAFREWLGDVLDGLGTPRASIGGMSLGAWAALDYAIARPERVAKVILICPSGICPVRTSFVLSASAYTLLGDWGLERMKRLIFGDAPISADAAQFFMLVGRHFNYRLEAPLIFSDDELRRATMPALYLAGEHDAVLQSRKTAERLERTLPHVTACLLEDGHAAINLAREVVAFLNQPES